DRPRQRVPRRPKVRRRERRDRGEQFPRRRSRAGDALVRPAEGAALRRGDRSDSRRVRTGRIMVQHDGGGRRQADRTAGWNCRAALGRHLETRHVRSRRAPRRSRAVLRGPPGRGSPRVLVRRSRDDRRLLRRGAGAGGGDVRARDLRPHVDYDGGGEALTVGLRTIVLIAAALAAVAGLIWLRCGPLPAGLLDSPHGVSTIVSDRNGEVLYEARAGDGSRGVALDARSLPQPIVDATIAAEDRRFWSPLGVAPIAPGRAAARDIRSRRLLEGGSTITQQTAKLLLARAADTATVRLKPDTTRTRRGIVAKVREAILAIRLEHRFS